MATTNTQAPQFRQPIIAILGHVDHGKTSLLDHIRTSHQAAKEIGGITQSIGAYEAEYQGKFLTFIDTPGHAAFSKMRSRGAEVADLAVLVIAADDGVKPQTAESIKYLHASKTPFIVALNKMDKPGVIPDNAKAQLTEHQVFVEGYGGNIPVVEISAKTGAGVSSLLENLLLMAELEELDYKEEADLSAPIIEAKRDMKRGILVSAIVRAGKIMEGDSLRTASALLKVKALFNDLNLPIHTVLPGKPCQILGFKSLPEVGELILPNSSLPGEPEIVESSPILEPSENKLNVVLKAGSLGSLEAIRGSLAAEINLIVSASGDITESDVLLASTTGSIILGFEVKANSSVTKLAETEGVTIKQYSIIYELLEYLEKKVLRLLEPTIDEEELGRAKILKIFEINADRIAGCLIESGKFEVGDTVHVIKKDGETKNARIKSIRVGKEELKSVATGKECGILFFPKLDLREKDTIISYKKNKSLDE
ncbi:MAG: Translation initiation factor IF-2 [Microgenomates group bacterium GW2011_GWF2_47_9]|nr:MAG: Translation initiation factor IF-2 [Microgenomates group bacterium GW2011_GWF2_47_9]